MSKGNLWLQCPVLLILWGGELIFPRSPRPSCSFRRFLMWSKRACRGLERAQLLSGLSNARARALFISSFLHLLLECVTHTCAGHEKAVTSGACP